MMTRMGKKKINIQSAKETLTEVIKEMAKPRVVASAQDRRYICRNDVLIVKNDVEK